jgi:polysaccharide chain length determinant protein (PEP-CTERM system associated)
MNELKTFVLFFWDQIKQRRWTALAAAWIVCLIGWLIVAMMPDRYASEARFHVDTTSLLTPLLKGISVNSDDPGRDQQVGIMQRTLTSRPNLLKVAQMTDLDKQAQSDAAIQDLLSSLEDRISIRSQGPNLFLVQFSDNSPVIARNVVQALLTIFVETSVGDKRNDIQSARSFIDQQIEEYEEKLKAAEKRVAEFKVENVQFLSSSTQSYAMRMENAQDALKSAKFEYDDAVLQASQLRQQLNATPQYLSINAAPQFVMGNMIGGSLAQRIMTLQGRLDELRLQFTEKHPDVINTQQALTRLLEQQEIERSGKGGGVESSGPRSQIPNELHGQLSLRVSEAEGRAATAKRKLAEAESIYQSLQARASEAPKIEAEFTNLNRDYEVFRSSYDTLLQRRESARIAAAADSTAEPIQFRLIAAPELPARPNGPPRTILNVLVFVAGLMAAGGIVFLLTRIEDHVLTTDDLAAFAEGRVLGSVTMVPGASPEMKEQGPGRFVWAGAALVGVFALILVTTPNFAGLARIVM